MCAGPARADEVDDARQALLRGDAARAIATLEPLARARSDDKRVQRELGFALLMGDRAADAIPVLERALTLDPTDLEVLVQLARALTQLGQLDRAIEAWQRAALGGPRHPVAWRTLAQLLLSRGAQGDRERARRTLELGTRECPDDEPLLLLRAEELLDGGQAAELEQAAGLLDGFARAHPGALEAGRRHAALLAAMGQAGAAAERLRELLPRAPAEGPYRDLLEAELALHAWDAAGRPGVAPPALDVGERGVDPSTAARRLDILLGARSEDGVLLLARARAELRRPDPGAALPWLEKAALLGGLEPGPVTADALLLQEVAHALLKAGTTPPQRFFGPEVSPAKARRLVALVGWLPAAHETLGRALEREGEHLQAAAAFETAAGLAEGPERERLQTLAAAARAAEERRRRNAGM